jgi:hypothetical protein
MMAMSRLRIGLALLAALALQPIEGVGAQAASPYLLPVPAGTTVLVFQGNNSAYDHVAANGSAYSWDFTVGATEFPVVAARGGTVIGARSDSTNTKCRDMSCWKDANYVVIDHGDGTSALYLHLATGSVAVTVGQVVAQGTVLGRADCTGYSFGTHLHFMVETTPVGRSSASWWWTQSISIAFADAGPALEDHSYLSQNRGGGGPGVTPTPTASPTPTLSPSPTPAPAPTKPKAPTSVRWSSSDEAKDVRVTCKGTDSQFGCFRVTVTWKWTGSPGTSMLVYFAPSNQYECFQGPCPPQVPHGECVTQAEWKVGSVAASKAKLVVMVPAVDVWDMCIRIRATNAAGKSALVWATGS